MIRDWRYWRSVCARIDAVTDELEGPQIERRDDLLTAWKFAQDLAGHKFDPITPEAIEQRLRQHGVIARAKARNWEPEEAA